MKKSFSKKHPVAYSILVVITITFIIVIINTGAWLFASYAIDNFSERTNNIITIVSSFIGAIAFVSPFIFLYERAKR